jgi:hypothetical protein
MLDLLALDSVGNAGYIGQAEHVIVSDIVCKKMGLAPFSKLIFSATGFHYGFPELVVFVKINRREHLDRKVLLSLLNSYCGRASIIHYIICVGMKDLKMKWSQYFASTKSVHQPNNHMFLSNNCYLIKPQEIKEALINLPDKLMNL